MKGDKFSIVSFLGDLFSLHLGRKVSIAAFNQHFFLLGYVRCCKIHANHFRKLYIAGSVNPLTLSKREIILTYVLLYSEKKDYIQQDLNIPAYFYSTTLELMPSNTGQIFRGKQKVNLHS